MSEKNGGHQHMMEIIDGDHKASVKHRGAPVQQEGGLAKDMSDGYEEANRHEEFKKGGSKK